MCVNGMFVALELKKSDKERPDPLQDHNLNLINKARGIGLKVHPDNWGRVYATLQILSEGGKCDRIILK